MYGNGLVGMGGKTTLHFPISHPEQANKPMLILLEERPVLEKSDPI